MPSAGLVVAGQCCGLGLWDWSRGSLLSWMLARQQGASHVVYLAAQAQ